MPPERPKPPKSHDIPDGLARSQISSIRCRSTTARLAGILAALAALVARALLRHPVHVAHIVPLWNYIGRTARRFTRTLDRLAAGTLRPHTPRPNRKQAAAQPRKPRGYPTTHAWLRATLAHEANVYGSQLADLLDQPETRALLQAAPQAARLLRPLCRYLGIEPDAIRPPPRQPAPSPSRPAKAEPPVLSRPRARPEAPATPSVFSPRPLQPLCPRLVDRWPFASRFA